MSSLGNPMFPQRPLPELETFHESIENSKKAKKESGGGDPGNKGVVDILADHGGKIALVVLAGVIALVYSYYLSGKDRNKIEDAISEAVFVEPYEIQELRFGNRLSTEEYRFIAAQAKAAFPTGQATYADFMKYLKRDLVIPSAVRSAEEAQSQPAGSQRRGVVWRNGQGRLDLLSTHLLDRMVMGLCLAQANAAASVAPTAGSAGAENPPASADAGAERSVAWAETPLDVTTLLAMLSLAMVPDAEARLQALHSLAAATAGDSSSSGSSGSSSQESSDALAVSETATRGTQCVQRMQTRVFSCWVQADAFLFSFRPVAHILCLPVSLLTVCISGDVLRLIRALIETDQVNHRRSYSHPTYLASAFILNPIFHWTFLNCRSRPPSRRWSRA